MFRIMDVRLRSQEGSDPSIEIDGLGQRHLSEIEPLRAALMLAAFNADQTCYWDSDKQALTTVPVLHGLDGSPIDKGQVSAWDVTIPVQGDVTYFVALISDDQKDFTSGNPAMGWATIIASDRTAFAVFEILNSPYCYYSQGILRNSDIRF